MSCRLRRISSAPQVAPHVPSHLKFDSRPLAPGHKQPQSPISSSECFDNIAHRPKPGVRRISPGCAGSNRSIPGLVERRRIILHCHRIPRHCQQRVRILRNELTQEQTAGFQELHLAPQLRSRIVLVQLMQFLPQLARLHVMRFRDHDLDLHDFVAALVFTRG